MSREKNRNARKRRKILSIMLSFFISLCTTLILVLIMLKGGLFNQELFKQSLNESTYYDSKLEDIKSNAEDILVSAGFPQDICDDVLTRTFVTIEVSKAMRGETDENTKLTETVKEKLTEYLAEKNLDDNTGMTEAVDRISNEITKVYQTHMSLLFVKMYDEFCDKYIHTVDLIMYISCAVLVICVIIVMMMYTRKYRAIRYVGYGIFAGSVMTEIISVISKNKLINMLSDKSSEYYDVISKFVDKTFSQGIYMCLGGIMLFCLIVMISGYMKKQVI